MEIAVIVILIIRNMESRGRADSNEIPMVDSQDPNNYDDEME